MDVSVVGDPQRCGALLLLLKACVRQDRARQNTLTALSSRDVFFAPRPMTLTSHRASWVFPVTCTDTYRPRMPLHLTVAAPPLGMGPVNVPHSGLVPPKVMEKQMPLFWMARPQLHQHGADRGRAGRGGGWVGGWAGNGCTVRAARVPLT